MATGYQVVGRRQTTVTGVTGGLVDVMQVTISVTPEGVVRMFRIPLAEYTPQAVDAIAQGIVQEENAISSLGG